MGFLRGGKVEILPREGAYIHPDGWALGRVLHDCYDWDQAEYRFYHGDSEGRSITVAVNVEVTGRTLQQPFGRWAGAGSWIRVKITFVADKCQDWYTGEMVGEDTVVRGWMEVSSAKIINH
jgi:hypothetical protein